ncbi:MAG: VIT family protein [Hyphomonadaceae bacterium]|nr:VIT family protein [Hyphomonadaceae bacterium]
MPRSKTHVERHAVDRVGWLRAAVLGANDGIVSTASLIVGVAAAGTGRTEILIAGAAGLIAGAMSMAAGEYVSVSSQSDAEKADLKREKRELAESPEFEKQELTQIYIDRGLEAGLARQVADQLMEKDALRAHARDELGITESTTPRPIQAAITSALTFAVGAALPLLVVPVAPRASLELAVAIASLASLALLGLLGARAGKASGTKSVLRIVFWGAVAMAVTAMVGSLFGAVV